MRRVEVRSEKGLEAFAFVRNSGLEDVGAVLASWQHALSRHFPEWSSPRRGVGVRSDEGTAEARFTPLPSRRLQLVKVQRP